MDNREIVICTRLSFIIDLTVCLDRFYSWYIIGTGVAKYFWSRFTNNILHLKGSTSIEHFFFIIE